MKFIERFVGTIPTFPTEIQVVKASLKAKLLSTQIITSVYSTGISLVGNIIHELSNLKLFCGVKKEEGLLHFPKISKLLNYKCVYPKYAKVIKKLAHYEPVQFGRK